MIKRGAIIHTDRGSQYASIEYRRLLYIYGFRQSMSGKGNCYDNAQAESFFSRFKAELVEGGIFESIEQARSEAFSYIEGYYNRIRRHSSLGYLSPLEFEKQLKITQTRRWDDELNGGDDTLMLRNVGVERQEAELSFVAILTTLRSLTPDPAFCRIATIRH